jgi:hypothetical protein
MSDRLEDKKRVEEKEKRCKKREERLITDSAITDRQSLDMAATCLQKADA